MTSRLLLACLGAFFFVAAWADCVTREPTAKEIDFHKTTFAALRSALAPAPATLLSPLYRTMVWRVHSAIMKFFP